VPVDLRASFSHAALGASGVVSEQGFKACFPPTPVLSFARTDRIDVAGATAFAGPDLRAIEGVFGHTLRRHVDISEAAVRERALRTHHDASRFNDAATAQQTVDEAFAENQVRIGGWLAAARTGNLALHVHFDRTIGRVFRYDRQEFEPVCDADVILEKKPALPQGYTVITAFPQ